MRPPHVASARTVSSAHQRAASVPSFGSMRFVPPSIFGLFSGSTSVVVVLSAAADRFRLSAFRLVLVRVSDCGCCFSCFSCSFSGSSFVCSSGRNGLAARLDGTSSSHCASPSTESSESSEDESADEEHVSSHQISAPGKTYKFGGSR